MNKIPEYEPSSSEHRRLLSFAVNQLIDGKTNAKSSFTLDANQTTTTVSDERVSADSHVSTTATTANAAAENLYITYGDKQFTVNHANAATTDRTFTYLVSTS